MYVQYLQISSHTSGQLEVQKEQVYVTYMVVLTNFFPHLRPSRESEQLYVYHNLLCSAYNFFPRPSASHKQKKKQVYMAPHKSLLWRQKDLYSAYK